MIRKAFFVLSIMCLTGILLVIAANRFFPTEYAGIISENALRYGLERELVFAVVKAESNFDKDAVSVKDAKGLMQVTEQTGEWCAAQMGMGDFDAAKLMDPAINVRIGCWYLAYLMGEYAGNRQLALAAYNAGPNNVNKWLKDTKYSTNGTNLDTVPFKETDGYLKKTALFQKAYKLILILK